MPPKAQPQTAPVDENETALDAIFNNMGGEPEPNDTELHTTDEVDGDGKVLGEGEEEEQEAAPPKPEAPKGEEPERQVPETVAALRLKQYETTLIPSLQRENERVTRELETERTRAKAYEAYSNDITSHGLTAEEASIGLRMAANYKLNPTKFIETLITNARAQGVPLPNAPSTGIDAATVASLVKQQVEAALRPINTRVQEQTAEQERVETLRREVNQFYTEFPDAPLHEEAIAYAMREHGLPLQRAYYEVKMWALQNGLDWTKPLQPQINARTNPQPPRSAEPPPGNRRNGNASTARATAPSVDHDVDWKTIVRDSVSEVMANGQS